MTQGRDYLSLSGSLCFGSSLQLLRVFAILSQSSFLFLFLFFYLRVCVCVVSHHSSRYSICLLLRNRRNWHSTKRPGPRKHIPPCIDATWPSFFFGFSSSFFCYFHTRLFCFFVFFGHLSCSLGRAGYVFFTISRLRDSAVNQNQCKC